MADDIVSFGLEVDSSQARKAKEDLNDLAKSGPAVEAALNRLKSAGTAGAAGVTAVGAAAARVKAETDRMRQAVVMANSSLGTLMRGLGSLGAIAGIGGTLSLGAIFSKFISETKNAQMEQAQLAAVLKSTGMAAGFTRAELNAMASDMAAMSTFTAGEINQAQTRLLSYSNIAHEMFPRAMQAVIDTSIRMGMSVTQAAETVGRALDIPSEGLSSLSRQGFRFTDEQKKMTKALEDTGRIAEAQGIVIEALESSYGGAAAAARNTLGGAMQALQNQISDLMTGGDGSIDGLTSDINSLTASLGSEETRRSFQEFVGLLANVAEEVVNLANQFAIGMRYSDGFFDALGKYGLTNPAKTAAQQLAEVNAQIEQLQKSRNVAISEASKPYLQGYDALSDEKAQKIQGERLRSLIQQQAYWSSMVGRERDKALRGLNDAFDMPLFDPPQLAPVTVKPSGGSKSGKNSKRKIQYDSIEDWMGSADGMARLADVEKQYGRIGDLIENRLTIAQTKYNRELEAMGQGDWGRQVNSALQEIRDKYQDLLEQRRNSSVGLSEQDEAALRAAMEREEQMAVDFYARLKEKQGSWLLGAQDALINYRDESENVYASIGNMVDGTFRGMEDALTQFVMTGKLSFKDLADSIISDMVRIAIQQSITGPLAGALGGALSGIFGGSSLPSTASWALPVMPSAKGNVFGSGSDLEYYRNTIVSSPTLFQFAKGGAFGLMGEAGPEAIMPLKRGPDGRLGVSTHGGGGSGDVTVNVINNSSQPVTASQPKISMDAMGRMVVEVMIADLQRNGPYARQLKGRG